MTKPFYEHTPTAIDGAFYSIYPDFYDTTTTSSSMDYGAVAAAGTGQDHAEVSATSRSTMPCPPSWDYGTVDVQMPYTPILNPGTVPGQGHALHHQAGWNYGPQVYPALTDTRTGAGTLAMADPVSQFFSLEQPAATADSLFHHAHPKDSTEDCYDSLRWPYQPPMGQISPSPSQGSYYISSPASGAGAHYSRHNSCSSLPAARMAALEQTRFDARFHPGPDQAISPSDGRVTPGGGLQIGTDSYASQTMRQQWREPQGQRPMMASTTDHDAGSLVSAAVTPSPRDPLTAVSSQPATPSARGFLDHQKTSRTSKRKDNPLESSSAQQQTTKQKKAEARGRSQQGHQQQQQQQPQQQQEDSQAEGGTQQPGKKGPAAAAASASTAAAAVTTESKQPTATRHRNRDAANKCRAKTKKAAADLESTERAMSSENRELSAVARGLRDEVLMLKHQLLAHGACDDDLIQRYLANQARRVGYGSSGYSSSSQQQQQHQPFHPH